MRSLPFLIGLTVTSLLSPAMVLAQGEGVDPSHQTTSTLTGGTSTGLFQTFSTRTLLRGEYSFGVFWHNFDRDPGDLDINRVPVNITYGLTSSIEVFLNVNVFQQVTTRQPFLLSGTVFNQRRIAEGGPGADPFVAFGPPQPGTGDGGAAFFPGTGNQFGSILPPVGAFTEPINGHLFVPFDTAGFNNDFPFFPFADASGPRMSANGVGDITLGLKTSLTDPDQHFSIGAAALLKIPSARKDDALADGRGAGAVDGGPVLIFSQQTFHHRLRIHENVGYMFTGGIHRSGVIILDRRDELLLNTGVEVAPWNEIVAIAEWNNTVYVGGGTPNLNPVNPMDLRLGARFFFFDGRFQIGGAWQTFLNNADTRRIETLNPLTQARSSMTIRPDDVNGFVFHLGYGKRPAYVPPPPPNRAPTINLEADQAAVRSGEKVHITARAADPDNDVLIFTWSTSDGRLTGAGGEVTLETAGTNPTVGDPPLQVRVSGTVDDGRGGYDVASLTITVKSPEPPPPPANRPPKIQSMNATVIGLRHVEGQITDGERLRISTVAVDPDGDTLTYTWSTTAGQLAGSGDRVILDTTDVTAGPGSQPVSLTINLIVRDGKGGMDSGSLHLIVHTMKKPAAEHLRPNLLFPRQSSRVNNIHKALLDDVSLRLQQDPSLILIIDGHQERSERGHLARRRAENVKRYVQRERGIDPERLVVRAYGARRPHPGGNPKLNRRVELWLVPLGADAPK